MSNANIVNININCIVATVLNINGSNANQLNVNIVSHLSDLSNIIASNADFVNLILNNRYSDSSSKADIYLNSNGYINVLCYVYACDKMQFHFSDNVTYTTSIQVNRCGFDYKTSKIDIMDSVYVNYYNDINDPECDVFQYYIKPDDNKLYINIGYFINIVGFTYVVISLFYLILKITCLRNFNRIKPPTLYALYSLYFIKIYFLVYNIYFIFFTMIHIIHHRKPTINCLLLLPNMNNFKMNQYGNPMVTNACNNAVFCESKPNYGYDYLCDNNYAFKSYGIIILVTLLIPIIINMAYGSAPHEKYKTTKLEVILLVVDIMGDTFNDNIKKYYNTQRLYIGSKNGYTVTLFLHIILSLLSTIIIIISIIAEIDDLKIIFFTIIPWCICIIFHIFIVLDYHYPRYNKINAIKHILSNYINIDPIISIILQYCIENKKSHNNQELKHIKMTNNNHYQRLHD